MIFAFLVGFAFGFFGSMPIAGPTAVVLVSQGLLNRIRAGIYIAAGAAVAESGYAFMAFLGLTAVLHGYPVLLPASRLVGAVLLALLGVYFTVRRPKKGEPSPAGETARAGFRNVLFGFSLTALNPTLIVTWTAAVGAAHAMGVLRVHALDAFPFAGGVITGIVGWFSLFLWLLRRFRTKVEPQAIEHVIRWMGVFLIVVGAALAVRAIVRWNDRSDLEHAKSVAPNIGRNSQATA